MSLYVFNNSQKLIRVISDAYLISLVQEQELNKPGTVFAEIPVNIWRELPSKAFYIAVKDAYSTHGYFMYKVTQETFGVDTVEISAVDIALDELKGKGYVQDRRFNGTQVSEVMSAIVDGTDWQVGYVDSNLPRVRTNFYYISRLEALSKLIEVTGGEVRFRVEVSGNAITAKRIDIYKRISRFKGKRFALGSNLMEVVKEEDSSGLYTALVGRGKGEELEGDTEAYGRRISFKDVEWSKAKGDPVDKPKGQEWVELPERTSIYGYPDGTPRTGIVEFTDTEEPTELLQQTYDTLLDVSRPRVQFKAVVETAGDMELGETVAIISPNFRYKTRVFKVRRNLLNNNHTEVEFGDKLTQTMGERIEDIRTNTQGKIDETVTIIQDAANGKNKIFRGVTMPTTGMMKGDLWYKPIGDGEVELYQYDGDRWVIIVHSGISKEIEEKVQAARNIASSARSRANAAISDLEEGASFYKHSDSLGLTFKNPAGQRDSIITVDSKGVYIGGENVVLDSDTIVDGTFTVTDEMIANGISASKLTTGTLNAAEVNIINLNFDNASGSGVNLSGIIDATGGSIGSWELDRGVLYSPLINGKHTTIKATGNVALATGAPDPYSTTGSTLQIWHDGTLRFGNSATRIYGDTGGNLTLESNSWIYLKPSASVFVEGRIVPWSDNTGSVGASDYEWYNIYGKSHRVNGVGVMQKGAAKADAASSLEVYSVDSLLLKSGVGNVYSQGNLRPYTNNTYWLGNAEYRWSGLYLSSGSVNESSDARLKDDIQSVPDKLINLFNDVKPKLYKMDGIMQFGYIAQDVERALFRYAVSEYGIEAARRNKETFNMVGQDESYLSLVYRQVSAIKDAQKDNQIKELEQRLEVLENGKQTTNAY